MKTDVVREILQRWFEAHRDYLLAEGSDVESSAYDRCDAAFEEARAYLNAS